MKKIQIILLATLSLFLMFYCPAEAHQPNFIDKAKEITVINPEISQAFYGFLDGQPVNFSIDSASDFQLYIQLLTPDVGNPQNNLFASITNENGIEIKKLDGLNNYTWTHWYEEFGGDWYWMGPEFKKELPAGQYTISVFNPGNKGEYVFVVGEKESFPLIQMPKMFSELYKIKTVFFQKPWYSVFQNKLGAFLGIGILIIIIVIYGIVFLIKFIKNKKINAK